MGGGKVFLQYLHSSSSPYLTQCMEHPINQQLSAHTAAPPPSMETHACRQMKSRTWRQVNAAFHVKGKHRKKPKQLKNRTKQTLEGMSEQPER